MKTTPFDRVRRFFGDFLLDLESRRRVLVAPPERRADIAWASRASRDHRRLTRRNERLHRDAAPLREVLARRPLTRFPRVQKVFWYHYGLFAPDHRSSNAPAASPSLRQASKAYDLARRGRAEAALRILDALIARLRRAPSEADDLNPARRAQLLTDACLFAGTVGYMVCDETAGAYYATACELASYKTPALLVLGAIFLRLDRTDEARTMWERALRVERESFAREAARPQTLGQWESMQDAKVELEILEAMVASLNPA